MDNFLEFFEFLDAVISFGPVTLTPFAFHRATALTRIDGEEDIPDPTEMTNMAYMFFRNYELAYGDDFDKFYFIWLPKGGLGKLVEIEKIEKEKILEIVR